MKYIIIIFAIAFIAMWGYIINDEPQFKEFITNPESWGEAMSTPLNRSQTIK